MSRLSFQAMSLVFRIRDLFNPPHKMMETIGIQQGMTVVDYGCGPGSFTTAAAKIVGPEGKVYAVDINPLAIESVRKRATRQRLSNIEAVLVDDFNTGISDACADCVLLMDMIHDVQNRDALFHEVRRLLKADGFLFLQIHHTPPDAVKADLTRSGLFTITKDRGEELLAKPA